MKTRTREVNIFNMSLIDILCGALGAFCFMMLVSLPYYRPPGSAIDLREQENQTQDLLKQLEKLRASAKDSELAQQMSELVKKLEDQIKQLQGQLNQYASQNEQLKSENDSLTKKNDEQARSLNARNPFLLYAAANDSSQALDLYLRDDIVINGKRNPEFDPAKPQHGHYWDGDIDLFVPGRGIAVWGIRDSPANTHYKLYVKLGNEAAARRATGVYLALVGNKANNATLPEINLSPERYWSMVGTLTADPQGTGIVTFKAATQAEQDEEWKNLAKSAPPTPGPVASPSQPPPSASASAAMTEDQRRALLERLKQQRPQGSPGASPAGSSAQPPNDPRALIERLRQQRGQSPASSPPPAQPNQTGSNSAEDRRALLEKLQRERQQQGAPSPNSSPSP